MMTLAVSDKCIPEWLSISRRLQDWGLVYWEAACLVWSSEFCVTTARCSCVRVVHWKVKVTSSLTDVWQQLFEQQDITVIVHMHHSLSPLAAWKPHQCTMPGDTNWNRNAGTCLSETMQRGMSMSWNGIWLKYSKQPAEINWSIDEIVLLRVSKPKANTLNICYDVFLYDM